jgi:predicted  nucleic acid-binding Zn-ribbon protein
MDWNTIWQTIIVASAAFAAIWKFLTEVFKDRKESRQSRDKIRETELQNELAKARDNILTASQVAELMKSTQEVKHEINLVKQENITNNKNVFESMDRLEKHIEEMEDKWIGYLQTRLLSFDTTVLKIGSKLET